MAGPSFFQKATPGLTVPGLIATKCGVGLLGDRLKDDGSCCAPTCGCWCVGVVTYYKGSVYDTAPAGPSDPYQFNCSGAPTINSCRACPSLFAYHVSSKGTHPRTDPLDWYCAGDTYSIALADNCHFGGPTMTITLRPTSGWVLYYDSTHWRSYVNIKFQNAPQGMPPTACCDTSTPCYDAINVPHVHDCTLGPGEGGPGGGLDGLTCADGTVCIVDDWNAGVACTSGCGGGLDPCGNHAGAICQQWGGMDVFGCPIPSGCVVCGNIQESPYSPDNSTRDFACP